MPVIYQKMIYREDLQRNPDTLYLFGDNEERRGIGGQAYHMRGEPNAVGIRTKRAPGWEESAYWSDETLETNKRMMEADFGRPLIKLRDCTVVVVSTDGLGTGLAGLPKRAPKTFEHLTMLLTLLEDTGKLYVCPPIDMPRYWHGSGS